MTSIIAKATCTLAQRRRSSRVSLDVRGDQAPAAQVRALRASHRLHQLVGGSDGMWVLPLHGGLPPLQQSRVFERPPPGVRKVRLLLPAPAWWPWKHFVLDWQLWAL